MSKTQLKTSDKTNKVVAGFKGFFKVLARFSSVPDIDQFGNIKGSSGMDQHGNINFSGSTRSKRSKRKKDPFFLNKKKDNLGSLESGQSVTDCMGQLFTLFKKIDEQEKLDDELQKFKNTEQLISEEERHQQIIKALETISKPRKEEVGKKTETKRGESTKKEEPEPVKPKPETPTATPVSKPSIMPTVTKAAIAGAGLSAISQAIGATEAGNRGDKGYDISFGDYYDNKGKMHNRVGVPTAEEFSGKKLSEMTIKEVYEFQKTRNSKNSNTGAVGKYQFINSTLKDLVKKSGISEDTVFSKNVQDQLQETLVSSNATLLKSKNVPITPGNLYMAHYVGAGGTKAVYDAAQRGENISVRDAILKAGLRDPGKQNKELNEIKVKDFEGILAGRLQKKGGLEQIAQDSSPTKVGDALSTGSSDIKHGKRSLVESGLSAVNNVFNYLIDNKAFFQMDQTASDLPAHREDRG